MTVEIEVTVPPSGISVEVAQTGAAGARGPQGIPGNDGADSTVAGPQGPQGDPGLSAYQEAQLGGFLGTEAQWLASLKGADGADGNPGSDGATGPAGPANSLAVGTVATGVAGSSVIATITGTAPSQTLNLTIPRGDAGATGSAGSAGSAGAAGTNGVDGKTWYSGSGAPSSGLGVNGDFYLDTTASAYYVKASGAWGSSHSIVGATGSAGSAGSPGSAGTDGKTVRNGSGAPSGGLGVDGDFYIDTTAHSLYGPKASGAWGAATSLIGPTGSAGGTGPAGAAGSTSGTDYTKTTASLANAATETGTWAPSSAQVHEVYKVTVDRAARVRFYDSTAHLTADASRAVGTDPTGDHGLLLEANFAAAGSAIVTSAARLFETSAFGAVPYSITNLSGSTSTVAVTLRAKGLV